MAGNVNDTYPVTFAAKRVEPGEAMFLAQGWIEGHDENTTFDLVTGAGLGSPLLRLTVERNGQRLTELIDIRQGLTAWVQRIAAEL